MMVDFFPAFLIEREVYKKAPEFMELSEKMQQMGTAVRNELNFYE
jgi:hypothetical protein